MKRTLWIWVLCCSILGNLCLNSLPVKAMETEGISAYSESESAAPYFWGHYTKTLVKYYSTTDVVPNSMYYEEYRADFGGTFSGTLNKVNVILMPNGWQYEVTFRGELYGHM